MTMAFDQTQTPTPNLLSIFCILYYQVPIYPMLTQCCTTKNIAKTPYTSTHNLSDVMVTLDILKLHFAEFCQFSPTQPASNHLSPIITNDNQHSILPMFANCFRCRLCGWRTLGLSKHFGQFLAPIGVNLSVQRLDQSDDD